MVRYFVTVRLTAERLDQVTMAGWVNATAEAGAAWEKFGGRLESYHFGNAADRWHVIGVGEVPSRDAAFALANVVYRNGGVVEAHIQELFTPEEADAAMKV